MATPLDNRQRVIVGGIGAMTPVFLNLLAVDMHVVFTGLTMPVLAGYLVRVAVLFFLGGFTAWPEHPASGARRLPVRPDAPAKWRAASLSTWAPALQRA